MSLSGISSMGGWSNDLHRSQPGVRSACLHTPLPGYLYLILVPVCPGAFQTHALTLLFVFSFCINILPVLNVSLPVILPLALCTLSHCTVLCHCILCVVALHTVCCGTAYCVLWHCILCVVALHTVCCGTAYSVLCHCILCAQFSLVNYDPMISSGA